MYSARVTPSYNALALYSALPLPLPEEGLLALRAESVL